MQIVDRLAQLGTTGPLFIASAREGYVAASGGVATLSGAAVVVPALDGHAVRLYDGEMVVTGAPDFTKDRHFTVFVVFRVWEGSRYRAVFERVNGGTSISVIVNSQGLVEGRVSSTRGGYSRVMRSRSRVDDGDWRIVAIKGIAGSWNSMALSLHVNGVKEATADISPGIFGTSPDYELTTPVRVGCKADTSESLDGDVAVIAAYDESWTDETIANVSAALTSGERQGFTGWGIAV